MVLKTSFSSKSWNFRVDWTIRYCSNFISVWYKHFLRNVWRDFRLPMSALAMVAGKSFNGKLTAKIDFSIGYVTIADVDIVSLKSLHTIFDKYFDHMLVEFEQNHLIWTIQNFELFDKKWLTIFDKVLTPFWKTFLWLKQLFDAKVLIYRLSSFCVPKITVVQHV